MSKTIWQKFIEGADGLPVPNASIEVRNESDGLLSVIYSDQAGSALSNPTTADPEGLATFYADAGTYKITATSGPFSVIFRFVPIGNAQARDTGTAPEQIPTNADLAGLYAAATLHNLTAITAPTNLNDASQGYSSGSLWRNTAAVPVNDYICIISTNGAAAWDNLTKKGVALVISDNGISGLSGANVKLNIDELAARTLQATETVKGIAEIATNAEALAGTDDVRFMTPLKTAAAIDATVSPEIFYSPFQIAGAALNIAGMTIPALCRISDSTVAFIDSGNDSLRAYEQRADGVWALTGAALAVAGVGEPAICKLSDGVIAFIDNANGQLRVYSFNGVSWGQLGASFAVASSIGSQLSICKIGNSNVYRIALYKGTVSQLETYEYNVLAGTWSKIGSTLTVPVFFDGIGNITTVDATRILMAANDRVNTYTWNGATWARSSPGNGLTVAAGLRPMVTLNDTDFLSYTPVSNVMIVIRVDLASNNPSLIGSFGRLATLTTPAFCALTNNDIVVADSGANTLTGYRSAVSIYAPYNNYFESV